MSRGGQRSKAEVTALRSHIDSLSSTAWIDPARSWWPRHLFHCTDILNVVNILKAGELLSRIRAKRSDILAKDIAAPAIIDATSEEMQDYVRLYFRPRTPTQYNNEGFRPIDSIRLGAHCPVPIYLLFDSIAVLSRQDCLFTDGNVASGATPMKTIDELVAMPFQHIYHDRRFDPAYRPKIVYHRNAEVLIPQRLDLRAVQNIFCRSQAEYETLLNLLPTAARSRWASKIGVIPGLHLFNAQWSFVRQVELAEKRVLFRFNEGSITPGPFVARVRIYESSAGEVNAYNWTNATFEAQEVLTLSLENLSNPRNYSVDLYLDEHLAFRGRHNDYDLPF